jgi:hypothetical protein
MVSADGCPLSVVSIFERISVKLLGTSGSASGSFDHWRNQLDPLILFRYHIEQFQCVFIYYSGCQKSVPLCCHCEARSDEAI